MVLKFEEVQENNSAVEIQPSEVKIDESENVEVDVGVNVDDEPEEVVATRTKNIFEEAFKIDEKYMRDYTPPKNSTPNKFSASVVNEFPMQKEFRDTEEILLPQFFIRGKQILLFGNSDDEKVSKEVLCKDCTLSDKDAEIDFEDLRREIVAFDFYSQSDRLTYKFFSERDSKDFAEHFNNLPTPGKIRHCAGRIAKIINTRRNFPKEKDVRDYITRVMSSFDVERLLDTLQHTEAYARRIEEKIDQVLTEYAAKNFFAQVDARRIFAKPNYKMPATITPLKFSKDMAKTLYTAEANDMNNLEYKIISQVSSLDNVRWWHRNRAKKEFFINGFINHYPDFMIMTESGILLLVEVKGDDRDNSDSRQKLNLGKLWESKANSEKYGYFMVFDKKPLEGALDFNDFVSRVKAL